MKRITLIFGSLNIAASVLNLLEGKSNELIAFNIFIGVYLIASVFLSDKKE